MSGKRLRVITLNTWKGDGAYRQRLDLAAIQLGELAPDILCLQEVLVTGDGRYNTARDLAKTLGLQKIYVPARKKKREVEGVEYICESGLAVLTNWEVIDTKVNRLPSSDSDPGRISLRVDLQKKGVFLRVINCHLTHIRDDRELRLRQLCHTLLESTDAPPSSLPVICCGDLNFTLRPDDFEAIAGLIGCKPVDSYLRGGGEWPGHTLRSCGRRIDYILAVSGNSNRAFRCENARVVLNHPDESNHYGSDHNGVLVDFYPDAMEFNKFI